MTKFDPENYFEFSVLHNARAGLLLLKPWIIAAWAGWAWVIDPEDAAEHPYNVHPGTLDLEGAADQ